MMIKYRVHEVAKDLGLPNKEVIDTLQKYTGETKKHMTALTENELDVVFEEFTQKNRVESFDEYFADQKEPAVTVTVEQEPAAPQKPAAPARPAQPQQGGNQPAQAKAPQQNGCLLYTSVQMHQKRVPLRMCAGCGESKPKKELVRVVRSPEGEISLDLTGKKPGRGAYVCKSADCLRAARKARRLERAFSCQIPAEVYDRMEEEIGK